VIVRIAPDVYVLYGHMQPGSVLVSKGQRVRRGQELGRIGTSGNSTTPHLHFQIMTTDTFFPTDSKPYAFEAFTLVAKESERIWDDNLGLQANWDPSGVSARADPVPQHHAARPRHHHLYEESVMCPKIGNIGHAR
jgi:murein DD-endopeptidase MepM/ murein hydrolase activator NlpD